MSDTTMAALKASQLLCNQSCLKFEVLSLKLCCRVSCGRTKVEQQSNQCNYPARPACLQDTNATINGQGLTDGLVL